MLPVVTPMVSLVVALSVLAQDGAAEAALIAAAPIATSVHETWLPPGLSTTVPPTAVGQVGAEPPEVPEPEIAVTRSVLPLESRMRLPTA